MTDSKTASQRLPLYFWVLSKWHALSVHDHEVCFEISTQALNKLVDIAATDQMTLSAEKLSAETLAVTAMN